MFNIDQSAARYLDKRSGAVTVQLKFESALGGCACSDKQITGSYVPSVLVGNPPNNEKANYQVQQVGSVKVYYPANLKVKEGYREIRIYLKSFLLLDWLEIEGAQGVSVTIS
ncbi:MAG: hypothetical protein H6Q73_303 [Firmicutes bacterium]|nr:hypothetical protein [Bacillota bacterium]